MRPRLAFHGLALLESPDVVDLWVQEEKDEAESQGVNLTHALLSGGAFGKYVEGISALEELQGGRFPDPEPRRLQRNADRHQRPVFFIEPLADDEDWGDYPTQEARAVSHWKKPSGWCARRSDGTRASNGTCSRLNRRPRANRWTIPPQPSWHQRGGNLRSGSAHPLWLNVGTQGTPPESAGPRLKPGNRRGRCHASGGPASPPCPRRSRYASEQRP